MYFTTYKNDPKNPKSLSHTVIKCILPDPQQPDQILWIGTAGGGLNRFEISSGNCQRDGGKEGMMMSGGVGVMKKGLSTKKFSSTMLAGVPIGMRFPLQSGSSIQNEVLVEISLGRVTTAAPNSGSNRTANSVVWAEVMPEVEMSIERPSKKLAGEAEIASSDPA